MSSTALPGSGLAGGGPRSPAPPDAEAARQPHPARTVGAPPGAPAGDPGDPSSVPVDGRPLPGVDPGPAPDSSLGAAPPDGTSDDRDSGRRAPPDSDGARQTPHESDRDRAAWKRARSFRAAIGGAPTDRADDGAGGTCVPAELCDAGGDEMSYQDPAPPGDDPEERPAGARGGTEEVPPGAHDDRSMQPRWWPPDGHAPPVQVLAQVVEEMHAAARCASRLRTLPAWPPDSERALLDRVATEMRAAARSTTALPDARQVWSSVGRDLAGRVSTLLRAVGREAPPRPRPHRTGAVEPRGSGAPSRSRPTRREWMDPRPPVSRERVTTEKIVGWSASGSGRLEDPQRRSARGQRRTRGGVDQQPGVKIPDHSRMHTGPPGPQIRQTTGPPGRWVSRRSQGPPCPSDRLAQGPPDRWTRQGQGPPQRRRLSLGPSQLRLRLKTGPPGVSAARAQGGDATWFAHHARPRGDPGGDGASDDGAGASGARASPRTWLMAS